MKVFTYGSLMRDGRLHGQMIRAGGEFISEATLQGFQKCSVEGAWFFAIRPSEIEHSVIGEIFEVPESGLRNLDATEGFYSTNNEDNLYDRAYAPINGEQTLFYIAGPRIQNKLTPV